MRRIIPLTFQVFGVSNGKICGALAQLLKFFGCTLSQLSNFFMQINHWLTTFMLPFTLRAALQVLLQDIRFKVQKDVHGEAMSAARLAPRRVAHPLFERGWNYTYHQLVNNSLTLPQKFQELGRRSGIENRSVHAI